MKKTIIVLLLLLLASCGSVDKNIQSTQDTKNKTQEQKKLITLGDSLTAGYNLDIVDSYPSQLEEILRKNNYDYKIINAGVSGDTSKNLLDRIELYDDSQPDIYIIGIGANDGLRRQSIENMKNNINEIIDHIQNVNPEAEIVLTGMQMPLNVGLSYSRDFKKTFSKIASEQEINFYEFLLDGVATKRDLNLSDGIHPNKKGYSIIANNIYNYLEKEKLIQK